MKEKLAQRLRLYVIIDPVCSPLGILPTAEAALRGGATALQLRAKQLPARAVLDAAKALLGLCRRYGALLIINDRADLAAASGADGVHLGQEDLPAADARSLLGPEAIIGVSCKTPDRAREAAAAGADYLGSGAVFASSTKPSSSVIGLQGLKAVADAVDLPVVGIGGITPERAGKVLQAGAAGVVALSAVTSDPDPEAATRRFSQVLAPLG